MKVTTYSQTKNRTSTEKPTSEDTLRDEVHKDENLQKVIYDLYT